MNIQSRFIGKTLADLAKELPPDYHNGYSVFVLQGAFDKNGEWLDESYSLRDIVAKHPEVADCTVRLFNDFYGTTVFRVL